MKYFETQEPYYSLIAANNTDEALKLYRNFYSEEDDDPEEFKEISREKALNRYISSGTENGYYLDVKQAGKSVDVKVPTLILIDGVVL